MASEHHPPYQLNDVGVHTAAEHGHGTVGMQTASGDVRGREMKVREGSSRDTECGGERLRGDLVPGSTNSNQAKGVIRAGTIEAKVDDTVDEHGSRAGNRVATAAMGNGFTTDSVLLGVKGEGRVRGSTDVLERRGEQVEGGGGGRTS